VEPRTAGPDTPPTLYVMVGLPGAGKTTRARTLLTERAALVLTPDEWMVPLFGPEQPSGKRDVLEGRFVWLALCALRMGMSVVLDFGVWAKEERSALKYLASSAGAACRLIYMPIHPEEQWRRIAQRNTVRDGTTFAITEDDLVQYRRTFQEPDADELLAADAGPPPPGYPSWEAWTAGRWPTSLPDHHA